jgi:RHS repeat-associated protein
VIAEVKPNGNIKRKYIHGPRVDEILAQKNNNNTLYLTRDGLGSTRELIKENGNVGQRFDYDPFGAVTVMDKDGNVVSDTPKTNYLFTGREFQSESGLYNYRNRFYHPRVGRFLQPDPIGMDGGINIYTYAGDNPINKIDPLGLYCVGYWAGALASSSRRPGSKCLYDCVYDITVWWMRGPSCPASKPASTTLPLPYCPPISFGFSW